MILSGQSIRKAELLTPFREKYIFEGISGGLSTASYDICLDQDIRIPANGFVLASSEEVFNMPDNVGAVNHDKSTWARRGISVQNTWTDPGFRGHLTLEISNNTNEPISIHRGTPICQVVFHFIDYSCEKPYDGKYQDQGRGPQEPR